MIKKNRILYILKILNEKTDDEHPLTAAQIVELLNEYDISVDRKTLYFDIKQLQDCGYDIVCNKSSQNYYFMGEREFQLPELKLLVDAVAASKFIPKKKSDELIDKLLKLTSVNQAIALNRKVYVSNRIKSTNDKALYIVDLIHTAINLEKQITFQYYEYNPNMTKYLKHNGQKYVFSPYEMVWNDDKYYVFGYSDSHQKIVKFRVDRIHNPKFTSLSSVPKPKDFNVGEFSNRVFQMFDGNTYEVELLCNNDLMKVIIDKFGEGINTVIIDDFHFKVIVQISASPTFFGWLFSFAGKMKLLSPQVVIDQYKEMAREI